MAKGQPDFGPYAPTETIVGMSDMGELAARLGSPVVYDRRGNIMVYDYFESGIEQWLGDGDAGYSVTWDSQYCKAGGFSCKMATGAVAGYIVTLEKYLGVPVISAMGFESSFSNGGNWSTLDFWLILYDGSYRYDAAIRYDAYNYKLQYLDAAGNFQDIPGGDYQAPGTPDAFDIMKFVADFTTAKYKRLLVNALEFDLSEFSFPKVAQVHTPNMTAYIELTADIALAAVAYIDDAIFTQNEP